MWNNKNIFEPSGCISREAFEAYINGVLPENVKTSVDAHIAGCEFCSDALEGFNAIKGKSNIYAILQKADKQFSGLKEVKAKDKANKRILWTAVSAAATILIIIGLFNIIKNQESIQQIAQNKEIKTDSVKVILAQKPLVENHAPVSDKIKDETPSHITTIPAQTIADNEIVLGESAAVMEEADAAVEPIELARFAEKKIAEPVFDTISDTRDMVFVVNERSESPAPVASGANFKRPTVRSSAKAEAASYSDEIITVTGETPQFKKGGVSDFQKYIQNKIGLVTDTSVSTKVYVQFYVDENGRVKNARVLGKNSEHEALIIKEVMNSPRWTPARQNGRVISTQVIIVVFIDDKTKLK